MKWRVLKDGKLISFLQTALEGYSGKFLRKVLEANCCKVNGQVERFGSRSLFRGDFLELAPHWKSIETQKSFELLYEDEFFTIVNKPAGWVCDSKSLSGNMKHLFLVHRLDKQTTGALILAKSPKIRDQFFELFEKREIEKTYLAVVDGIPKQEEGEIRSFLTKKGTYQGQTIWGSSTKGLSAITQWKTTKVGKLASLISLAPKTGRTHQIRVHMAEIGHPILVDRQYAKTFRCPTFSSRTLLHAERLRFSFEEKLIEVKAPLFLDMRSFLGSVGIQM